MSLESEARSTADRNSTRGFLKFAAASVVLGLVLLALVAWFGTALWRRFNPLQTTVTVSDSTVVRSIQQLQRLESVVYKMDQVVTEEQTSALPPSLIGDRILLIVHGEVTAGIDLAKLRAQDVQVNGRSIKVRLPRAEIFTTRTDTQRTRVYSRDTGLFSSPDPQMETRVRRRAERQLTAAALKEGILAAAEVNARNTVVALLHSAGFQEIKVE